MDYTDFTDLFFESDNPGTDIAYAMGFGMLEDHPEITGMVGVPQNPEWHPEGDVFLHTMMVVDEAQKIGSRFCNDGYVLTENGFDDYFALMFGALAHDFGKPEKTAADEDGRIRSKGHEHAGVGPARTFLERIGVPEKIIVKVEILVEHHLAPVVYPRDAKPRAYRRLARKLSAAGVSPELLAALATADQFGRTTEKALARDDSDIADFLSRMNDAMEQIGNDAAKPKGTVTGRMLVDRGYQPGPDIGRMIEDASRIEQEQGVNDPDQLIAMAAEAKRSVPCGMSTR